LWTKKARPRKEKEKAIVLPGGGRGKGRRRFLDFSRRKRHPCQEKRGKEVLPCGIKEGKKGSEFLRGRAVRKTEEKNSLDQGEKSGFPVPKQKSQFEGKKIARVAG